MFSWLFSVEVAEFWDFLFCRFGLLLAVGLLLAQACAAEITFDSKKGEDAVNKKVEHARSVAHLTAAQSEKEIAKLVSVFFWATVFFIGDFVLGDFALF